MTEEVNRALQDPERLAALGEIELLDRPSLPSLDRCARLASLALRAPVSLVSLVDGQRQFFSSQVGLPAPWSAAREAPLSHSFCKHVVAARAALVVDDARQHPVMRDNLAVRDLAVVAYAGMPIVTDDGRVIGSFCAIDARPRTWDERELGILRELAAAVCVEINRQRQQARVERSERALALLNDRMLSEQQEVSLRGAPANHDLRTPLGALALGVSHLGCHAGVLPYPELARLQVTLQRSAAQALALLNTMGSAAASPEHLVLVEVVPFVRQVCNDVHERDDRIQIDVAVQAPAAVLIAPTQLRRCIEDLLSNAQRFATRIVVTIDAHDGEATISVEDNGPGLHEDRDSWTEVEEPSGRGLGLSLLRDVIVLAGGRVLAHRSELGGACITLFLPASA